MEDDWLEEIEAKLEVLRQRGEAYRNFVSPEGQPPLLWEMAMLAQAGWTILPRVEDFDQDKCFPEMRVELGELEWSSRHRCLIGGEKFQVMVVDHQGYLVLPVIPKVSYYYKVDTEIGPSFETHVYRPRRWALAARKLTRSIVLWEAEFYVLQGSSLDGHEENTRR